MILREQPSSLHLFFVLKGSVAPKIISKVVGVAVLSVMVLGLDHFGVAVPHISIGAMGVFGVALSLFLGFRNNAAYDRWWESRKLWGTIIAETRTLARHMAVFVGDDTARDRMLCTAVAFAHLHRGFLRRRDVADVVTNWVGAEQAAVLSKGNGADAALRDMADQIAALAAAGRIDRFGQMTLSQTLAALAHAQAGCERIVTTPLPFVYSLLVRRTTYLYCGLLPFALIEATGGLAPVFAFVVAYIFFGLQTVTNELERPFHDIENGVPVDALCRVIEISACEAMGRPAPAPLAATDHVLT